MSEKIAVVGAGLVGRAWAITFARAGRQVGLWDPDPAAAAAAIANYPAASRQSGDRRSPQGCVCRRRRPTHRQSGLTWPKRSRERFMFRNARPKMSRSSASCSPSSTRLRPAQRGARQLEHGDHAVALYRRCRRACAVPCRPSYQPALPRAGGRDRAGTLDRSRDRRAHARPDGRGRASARSLCSVRSRVSL